MLAVVGLVCTTEITVDTELEAPEEEMAESFPREIQPLEIPAVEVAVEVVQVTQAALADQELL
jgi:hypothetical protein